MVGASWGRGARPRALVQLIFLPIVVAALLADAGDAHAAAAGPHDRRSCVVVYKAAEKLASSSHLRRAKELMLACAKPACGVPLRRSCLLRAAQLQEDIPTIVPVVTDDPAPKGVQVSMDGELLTSRIDGSAVPIDPGTHEFSFSDAEGVIGSQKVVILQGQRNRPIAVSRKGAGPAKETATSDLETALPPPPVPAVPPPRETRRPAEDAQTDGTRIVDEPTPRPERHAKSGSVGPYLLGVAGLAGIGGYALLTYWGRQANAMLSQCAPACPVESVNHIRRRYLEADVSLGVGAAALVASTVWLVVRSRGDDSPRDRSYSLEVQPTARGAVAGVSGRF
jgi:hypothetical protein